MTRFTESAIALPDLTLPNLSLPNLSLPNLSLPELSVSDSLGSLAAMANQLQAIVNGAITHPIWAIALVLLTITLIQIIADLAKRILKAGLAFILKLPLSLSQWLWKRATAPSKPDESAQVHQLIAQLESLRAEQDQVIAQLKQLLSKQPYSDASDNTSTPFFSDPSEQTLERTDEEQTQAASSGASKSSSTVSPEVG